MFLSAAESQRPRNNSSCCCSLQPKAKILGITWVVLVAVGFFFPPIHPPTHPSTHPPIHPSIHPSSSIFICQSINQPLPFPKYQYIVAADPGAGVGLLFLLSFRFSGLKFGAKSTLGGTKTWAKANGDQCYITILAVIYFAISAENNPNHWCYVISRTDMSRTNTSLSSQ